MPKEGKLRGYEDSSEFKLNRSPWLHEQFPYTETIFMQVLAQRFFQPGKTYAIWFCFSEKDLPDIAFAITIDSKRGEEEYGKLPLR